MATNSLVWVGAPGGQAWKGRPLRVAFERDCLFRKPALEELDVKGITWESAVDTDSYRTVEASVSADLAVHAGLLGSTPVHSEVIAHDGALPDLPNFNINMYQGGNVSADLCEALAQEVRAAYRGG